jgi:hypothetical protein
VISGITYESSSQTLTCTSSGGPATSVTWSRDNTPLVVDGTIYQQSQVIIDTNTATYQNTLVVQGSPEGVYVCTISNTRGNDSAQHMVKGITSNSAISYRIEQPSLCVQCVRMEMPI